MKTRFLSAAVFAISGILVATGSGVTQNLKEDGTKLRDSIQTAEREKPRIEGIKQFHDLLAPIWHTTLPDSDFQSIKEVAPEMKKAYQKIVAAEIPPYYQHVKDDFILERDQLGLAVQELDTVAETGADLFIPEAIDDVHSAFEEMIRVLSPRTKEVEDFHLVLYPLWHVALPKSDWLTIKTQIPIMRKEMDTLMTTPIPQWLGGKELRVVETREALDKVVDELVEACKTDDSNLIKKRLKVVHSRFRTLDEVFD